MNKRSSKANSNTSILGSEVPEYTLREFDFTRRANDVALYSPPPNFYDLVPNEKLTEAVVQHLVQTGNSMLELPRVPSYSMVNSPCKGDIFSNPSGALPPAAIESVTPYYLQGAATTSDIYKMANELRVSALPRTKSLTDLLHLRRQEIMSGPTLENVAKPGGFRRHFVHERQCSGSSKIHADIPQQSTYQLVNVSSPTLSSDGCGSLKRSSNQSKRTRHFLEFLALDFSKLFDKFAGEDFVDYEVEDEEPSYKEGDIGEPSERSPLIARNIHHSHILTPKTNIIKSFFLLLKAFVGAGVLFLPKAFSNGGMLFSTLVLWAMGVISLYSFLLLVRCKERIPGSFGDIGGILYGKWMKRAVLVAISVSQIGFVCGSSIFIAENLQQVVQDISHNLFTLSTPQILFFTGIFLTPLILIRNIARLSFVAVISSVLFLTGLVALIYFDVKSLFYSSTSEGINFTPGPNITYYFNPISYSVFIGTAVYSFEGIGLIIPIYDAMAKPQYFPHVLTAVMTVVALVFSLVGGLGYFAFGSKVQTVALLNLPNGPVVHTIRVAYTIAAALSNALTIFPAVRIIENAVFKQKTGKLNLAIKWQKNLLRVGIVVLTMFIAMFGAKDLDKFISLIGSICCTPLSLIFPSLFHYRAIATTKRQKIIDISLACFGTFIMLFTVWTTASQWGTPT